MSQPTVKAPDPQVVRELQQGLYRPAAYAQRTEVKVTAYQDLPREAKIQHFDTVTRKKEGA